MSLPVSQRRALNQIEKALADDHPGLGPLFAIFTRLTGREAMPVTERVTARPGHRHLRRCAHAVSADQVPARLHDPAKQSKTGSTRTEQRWASRPQ
jgi:hypothetical protein